MQQPFQPPMQQQQYQQKAVTGADIKGFRVVVEPRVDAAAATEVVEGASIVPCLQL
jgi:hypothetical protein